MAGSKLAQQRGELTEDLSRQVTQLSKTLDTRFSYFLENTSHKLKFFIAEDFRNNKEFAKNQNWSRCFNQKISELVKHEEVIVIDADARDHMFGFLAV